MPFYYYKNKFKCYWQNCETEIVVPLNTTSMSCPNCQKEMRFEGEVQVEG